MTEWKFKEGSIGYRSWLRSYRQTIETGFHERIFLNAFMEELRLYDDGRFETNRNLPPVTIFLDELVGDDLVRGFTINEALTKLIGDKVLADAE